MMRGAESQVTLLARGYILEDFDDIRVVDLDEPLTRQSQTASGLRHMHLRLSGRPSHGWAEIFIAERQFPRHSMWRNVWISGSHVVIDCVPEEIEKYHLRDIKEDVANTNIKYRAQLQRVELARRRQDEAARLEKERIQDVKKKLKFD